jgi:DNA (cytosine-5)-methyltransferase 1
MNVLDLFSGIGGFSLGLERAGMKTIAFCEIDKKAQLVLKKHWPEVPIFEDVSKLKKEDINEQVDVICGGFPCQDISLAGRGEGLEGKRSGLWFEFHRLIKEIRPRYAIIENVSALRNRGLDEVLRGLSEIGYDAEWHCIPASAVGAPHQRDRIWIIAHIGSARGERLVTSADIGKARQGGVRSEKDLLDIANSPFQSGDRWPTPLVRRMDDGIPNRVDRLKQLGNAVVPQIPEIIGRRLMEIECRDPERSVP